MSNFTPTDAPTGVLSVGDPPVDGSVEATASTHKRKGKATLSNDEHNARLVEGDMPKHTDVSRVCITLSHHETIPPTGLFVAVNGFGFMILPGEKVRVPKFVLEVLDNAVESKPEIEDGKIVGYRDVPRFSYRIHPDQ